MATIDIKVPDLGDFKDVPVIEVLVKPGDAVQKEDSLVTLESDKATMEVPSTHAGTVKEVKVKIGDKVSQGALIATLDTTEAGAAASPSAPQGAPAKVAPAPQPAPATPQSSAAQVAALAPTRSGLREALTSTLASLD